MKKSHFITAKTILKTVCGTVDVQGQNTEFWFKALVLVRVLESALHIMQQHVHTLLKNIRSITKNWNLITTTTRLVFMHQGLADIITQKSLHTTFTSNACQKSYFC